MGTSGLNSGAGSVRMPREYSKDFRWRAIWLTEIVGVDVQDASFYLQLLKKTISRYINTFRMLGNVDTAVIGRPYTCISMHPHELGMGRHGITSTTS